MGLRFRSALDLGISMGSLEGIGGIHLSLIQEMAKSWSGRTDTLHTLFIQQARTRGMRDIVLQELVTSCRLRGKVHS